MGLDYLNQTEPAKGTRLRTILDALRGQDVLSETECRELANAVETALQGEEWGYSYHCPRLGADFTLDKEIEENIKSRLEKAPYWVNPTLSPVVSPISRVLGRAADWTQIAQILRYAPNAKVHVHHERKRVLPSRGGWPIFFHRGWGVDGRVPSPRGGTTFVRIEEDGSTLAAGAARCSEEDQFCRRTGISIALKRAILDLENIEVDKAFKEGRVAYHKGRSVGMTTLLANAQEAVEQKRTTLQKGDTVVKSRFGYTDIPENLRGQVKKVRRLPHSLAADVRWNNGAVSHLLDCKYLERIGSDTKPDSESNEESVEWLEPEAKITGEKP